jgi:hypothetical protein
VFFVRRSGVDFPAVKAARSSAKKFFAKNEFWRICITLARRLRCRIFDRRWSRIFDRRWRRIFDRRWSRIFDRRWRRIFDRRWRRADRPSGGQFLLPLAVGLAVFAMLGPTAICSAVFSVGFSSGFLPGSSPLKFDCRLSTRLTAEDFGGMIGRKKPIARLP